MAGRVAKPVEIYQIKVTLLGAQPPIWRRIQVRSDTMFARLHSILQRVMGWEDAHLHQFIIQGEPYGALDKDSGERRKTKDERKHTLSKLVMGTGGQFAYTYDFGDNWEHILEIEKTLPPEEGVRYPQCLAGARACPPEDVGGIPGYENFLQALKNPDHPEHDECLEWIGATFDPEAFDITNINQRLSRLK